MNKPLFIGEVVSLLLHRLPIWRCFQSVRRRLTSVGSRLQCFRDVFVCFIIDEVFILNNDNLSKYLLYCFWLKNVGTTVL